MNQRLTYEHALLNVGIMLGGATLGDSDNPEPKIYRAAAVEIIIQVFTPLFEEMLSDNEKLQARVDVLEC